MTKSPMPRIEGLYETHLTVSDLDRSVAFYRDIVGLELARVNEERGVAFFWINGRENSMLGLWNTGTGPMRMHLHIALRTTLEAVLSAAAGLKSHGLTPLGFRGRPAEEPDVIGWMPAASQYFADPDGHSIEFIALLDEPPDDTFGVGPYSRWLQRR